MIEVNKDDLGLIERTLGTNTKIISVIIAGNSRVFIVKKNGTNLVVKKYLGSTERINQSMNREVDALTFLKSKNIRSVPKLMQINRSDQVVVMEYLRGTPPSADSESIEAIITFSKHLNEVYKEDRKFGYSIDGITKTSDLLSQIESRIVSIESRKYADKSLAQAKESILRFKAHIFEDKIWNPTYSVSDLGIHNMVKSQEGIRFFDLEFFGADSPIKVIGDFLLHPKNTFPNLLRHRFYSELKQVYGVTESSIAESLPVIALKWYVIVLPRLFLKTYSPLGYSHQEAAFLAKNYLRMANTPGDEILYKSVYYQS